MSHSGGQIGNIVALLSGGYLCYIEFAGGWPSIFYIYGLVGMVWVGVIFLFFSSTPNENRFISFAEKSYLNQNIKIEDKKNMVT
jgi:ACS family sodium-dependent inorganic phosphate cotransporter-like MFS transporter 5